MCTGNDCNSLTQFQHCYVNNTDYKPKPSTLEHADQSTICNKFDDKCFTLISEDNTIVKDCLHGYAEHHNLTIDFLKKYNKSSYDVCSTNLCNSQTIRPTYCIQCDSNVDENCDSKPLEYETECPLEVNASGCFHRFDGQNTQRGCIGDLDEKLRCESDSDECKKCMGNACNSRIQFQTCITDNLRPDDEPMQSKLCKRYTDDCFIHLANDTLRRGCRIDVMELPEIGIDLESDCKNSSICEVCSEKNDCNDREITNEQCIECKTINNGLCAMQPNLVQPTNCPLALRKQGCYLMQERLLRFQRGCIAHLDDDDRDNCSHGNSTCKMCVGNKCNAKQRFQTCYECASPNNGGLCLDSPALTHKIACAEYWGHCYTIVTKDVVRRGCAGDETIPTIGKCKKHPSHCKHCKDNQLCNIETVKPITCISCDSLTDPKCATDAPSDKIKTCSVMSLGPQQCYHYINATSQQHIRGNYDYFMA